MIRAIFVSAVSFLTMFFSWDMQAASRRTQKQEKSLAAEWVAATPIAALAVLPATGAIIEANPAARLLFPGIKLLELEVGALWPSQGSLILDALAAAHERGTARLDLGDTSGGTLSLIFSTTGPGYAPVVVMLVPQAELPEGQLPPEPPPVSFPPLVLDRVAGRYPIEKQLGALLDTVVAQWPVRGVALLRRQGMTLIPLASSPGGYRWDRVHLPAAVLGSLLLDGSPADEVWEGRRLLLHPLVLPPDKEAWGALALMPDEEQPAPNLFTESTAHAASLASLVLRQARAEGQLRRYARAGAQLTAVRDHLLARSTRGVLLVDGEGRIAVINGVASKLLQWPARDVTGRPLESLLGDLGPLGGKIATALEAAPGDGEPLASSGRLQRPGKRGRELAFAIEPVRGARNYRLLFLDDHEGAAAFTETQHHLDRLAVLGKMSASIAHDLRNPVGALIYGIETLAETLGEDDPNTETLHLLLAEGERVHRIIEDILSISRQPSLMISLCSLRALIDRVLDTHERTLREKRIQIRRYYDPALPMIEGDPVRLGQLLGNLVNNAIDAMGQGGQLETVLRPLTLDQMVARGLNPDQEARLQGGVEIIIRDNGPGIPEAQREQIFEPLFTTKSTGTGLGLAIVRTIVEQHRGLLFLDSEVGRGTTFQIFLPQLAISATGG